MLPLKQQLHTSNLRKLILLTCNGNQPDTSTSIHHNPPTTEFSTGKNIFDK